MAKLDWDMSTEATRAALSTGARVPTPEELTDDDKKQEEKPPPKSDQDGD